jgi:hypothetical protein
LRGLKSACNRNTLGGEHGSCSTDPVAMGGYFRYHGARANLIIHAVPLFLAGSSMLVMALLRASAAWSAVSIACMVVSIAVPGRGHKPRRLPRNHSPGSATRWHAYFSNNWSRSQGTYCPDAGFALCVPRHLSCGQMAGPGRVIGRLPAISGRSFSLLNSLIAAVWSRVRLIDSGKTP